MIRIKHLIRGRHLSILRLDHQPHTDHRDPEEEICSNYAVNFVEGGSFGLAANGKRWLLSCGYVFLSQPGAVHRYSHDEKFPSDVCLSVVCSPTLAEEISAEDYFVPASSAVISPTNRLAFLKLRLERLADDDYAFGLEDLAYELFSVIRSGPLNTNCVYRERQLLWYAERIEAILDIFNKRYADAHSLTSVARSVGMSPFQFARVFSELVGTPPHRYLLSVRLDRALQMLLDGKSVTETCFDVGFSNLSHFTRSFQRRFGVVPSSLKAKTRVKWEFVVQRRKKVQAIQNRLLR